MSKSEDILSEVLNIENKKEVVEVQNFSVVEDKKEFSTIEKVAEEDTQFARDNIKTLISQGNIALDSLLSVARESEHPRAYEVAATMIKTLSDSNRELLNIQKTRKALTTDKQNNTENTKNMNIDKAVFVGSTTELVKFLKNNKEQ